MPIRGAWTRFVAVACCLSASVCMAQDKAPEAQINSENDLEVFVVSSDDGAIVSGSENVEPPKYWIGLLCVDLSEALHAQLDLESGVGLLVDTVTDDGPAKKQGIQRHDILISARLAGESPEKPAKKLSQVTDLVEVVQAAETKTLQLEIIRQGQRKMIEVAPVGRPKQDHVRLMISTLKLDDFKLGDEVTRQLDVGNKGNPEINTDIRLFLAGPMFESTSNAPALPAGMSMEFHQIVGEHEKITVKKGEQKWEFIVEEVVKLPEEIRLPVLQQLAARRHVPIPQIAVVPTPVAAAPVVPKVPATPPVPVGPHVVTNVLPRVTSSKPDLSHVDVTTSVARIVLSPTTDLPDNVTVSIIRKGSDPAKITVTKDELSWEITKKELDKLPIDVRKLVEPLIPNPRNMTARVQYSPYTYKKSVIGKESTADGKSPTKPISPDESSPVDPKLAETQRQRAESIRKHRADRVQDLAAGVQAREAFLDKMVKELHEKIQSLKQLKELNEKIDKLQQALDKSSPK